MSGSEGSGSRSSGPTLRHRAEFLGLRAAKSLASAVSRRAAERAGKAVGGTLHAAGLRRDAAERQVAAAFPDRDEDWVRATVRACYRHFGREAAVLARLDPSRPERVRESVSRVGGTEALARVCRRAASSGTGAVVVAGHLGNWELGLAALGATGVPVAVVVKRQANPLTDAWARRRRDGLAASPVYMERAPRRVPEALEGGRAVVLAADQDAVERGVFVPFLGRPASTHRGPAAFSLAHAARLVFAATVREGDGYRMLVREVDRSGLPGAAAYGALSRTGRSDAARELTRRWVAVLETEIRRRPQQYLWFHRRWKTRPGAGAAAATGAAQGRATR